MANYASLINNIIKANIFENHQELIDGGTLQNVLVLMVEYLGKVGFQFQGIATEITQFGTPDYNIAYIAPNGTYSNGLTIPDGHIGVMLYNGGDWQLETFNVYNIIEGSVSQALQDAISTIHPIVIEGDVVNAPDEEDITTVNDLLKNFSRSC